LILENPIYNQPSSDKAKDNDTISIEGVFKALSLLFKIEDLPPDEEIENIIEEYEADSAGTSIIVRGSKGTFRMDRLSFFSYYRVGYLAKKS
jgi:hypothetical protein